MNPGIAVIVGIAAVVAIILCFVIAAAVRPNRPGRHAGSYLPAKARRTIRGATDHNASDGDGPRSMRFPEMERFHGKPSASESSRSTDGSR